MSRCSFFLLAASQILTAIHQVAFLRHIERKHKCQPEGADRGKFRRKTARHPGDLSPGSGDCAKSLRWDKSQDKWKPLSAVGKKRGRISGAGSIHHEDDHPSCGGWERLCPGVKKKKKRASKLQRVVVLWKKTLDTLQTRVRVFLAPIIHPSIHDCITKYDEKHLLCMCVCFWFISAAAAAVTPLFTLSTTPGRSSH